MNSRPSSAHPYHHSQRGFSLVVLFAAIAGLMVVVTLYVIAPGARDGIGQDAVAAAQAAGIVQQGALLEGAYVLKLQQGVHKSHISYDATLRIGMLVNPNTTFTLGLITRPVPSPDAFVVTGAVDGMWIYRKDKMRFPGVGVNANYDYSFLLTNLKKNVCEKINWQVHGANTIPVVGTIASLRVFAPNDLNTVTDLTGFPGLSGWTNGCIASSDGTYAYFQVVLPN